MSEAAELELRVPAAGTRRTRQARYPAYRDSGVTWIGQVPAHWPVAPVYARYDLSLGKMLDAKRVSGEQLAPYVRNVDVQWDRVNTDDLAEMDFAASEYERYGLKSGDLLVCEGGEIGRAAIWPGKLSVCYFQKAIHRLRPRRDSESARYLFHVLRWAASAGVFVAGANANTIDHLTAVQLRHYRFPFPPDDEQDAIASFLDGETARIDALVEKKRRLIELLREERAAIIARTVTRGLDPGVPMKASGDEHLGRVPSHWTPVPLMHLTQPGRSIMYGIVLPGPDVAGGVPIVKGGDVAPGQLRLDLLNRTSHEIEAGYVRSRLRPGDIVYAIRGSIGMADLVPDELEGANLTQDAARIAPEPGVDPRWLLYAVRSGPVFAQLDARATGATIRGINIRDLKRAVIPLPPPAEQSAIAEHLDREVSRIDALIAKVEEHQALFAEHRQALIAAAVTGQIDVRNEVPA